MAPRSGSTFRLSEEARAAAEEIVAGGYAPSLNAAVELALRAVASVVRSRPLRDVLARAIAKRASGG